MKRNIFWMFFSCLFVIYNSCWFCWELKKGEVILAGIFLGFALINTAMFALWTKKAIDDMERP